MLTPLRLELLDLEVRRSWTARFAATAGVLFGLLAGVILQDLQIRDGVGERIAKARLDAAWSKGVQVGEIGVPDFRATSERDDGANERIAPSLDVCDVSLPNWPSPSALRIAATWTRRLPSSTVTSDQT